MPSATEFRRAFGLEPGARIGTAGGAAAGSKRRRGAASVHAPPFELASVHVGHEALSPHERYAFPTTLLLAPSAAAQTPRSGRGAGKQSGDAVAAGGGARDAAAAALRDALRDRHVVYSAYGSPYECSFDLRTLQLQDAAGGGDAAPPGAWRATLRGLATRRRDVPTKAQAAQHAAGTAADDAASKQAAKAESARVRAEAKERGMRVVVSRFGTSVCDACGAAIDHRQLIARPDAADAAGKHGGWMHAACALQPRTPRRKRA